MQYYDYFSTRIWFDQCNNIDNKKLKKDILEFSEKEKNQIISNVGGYQGHKFHDQNWYTTICSKIPLREDKPIANFKIYNWVNINKKGDYNQKHTHLNTNVFLCGVYYVSVPENSGDIKFYDPRGPYIVGMVDHQYYSDGFTYYKIKPEEGMVIFFPPWLEHDVDTNESDEDRISIAFNIEADGWPNPIKSDECSIVINT